MVHVGSINGTESLKYSAHLICHKMKYARYYSVLITFTEPMHNVCLTHITKFWLSQ